MQSVSTAFMEMNRDVDDEIQTEPSRIVKIMLVKYKCAILFTVLILAFLQVIYLVFNQLDESGKIDRILDIYETNQDLHLDQSSNNTFEVSN